MNSPATLFAAASVLALGAFWPTLKVHFEKTFVQRFTVPAFFVAVADCFTLSTSIEWWTILAYPLLLFLGAAIISPFTNGARLRAVVLGGGIWLVGVLAVMLAAIALAIWAL